MSDKSNIMEDYLRTLIKDELDKQLTLLDVTLKEEDAAQIVLAILPHIDGLISKRIKQHLKEVADLMKEKFSI